MIGRRRRNLDGLGDEKIPAVLNLRLGKGKCTVFYVTKMSERPRNLRRPSELDVDEFQFQLHSVILERISRHFDLDRTSHIHHRKRFSNDPKQSSGPSEQPCFLGSRERITTNDSAHPHPPMDKLRVAACWNLRPWTNLAQPDVGIYDHARIWLRRTLGFMTMEKLGVAALSLINLP